MFMLHFLLTLDCRLCTQVFFKWKHRNHFNGKKLTWHKKAGGILSDNSIGLVFLVGLLSCLPKAELSLLEIPKYIKLVFLYILRFEVAFFCFCHTPVPWLFSIKRSFQISIFNSYTKVQTNSKHFNVKLSEQFGC